MKRLTPFEFIEQANVVHGNRFDYSKIKYVYSTDKVPIICKEHGEFEQRPNDHLKGHGCDKCGGTSTSDSIEFIEKAKIVHGNKFKYDKVNYTGSKNKVTIICKEHGEFEQIPNSHLSGHGCYKCSGTNISDSIEFIKKAKIVHGNKFKYDKVNYTGNKKKVIIICKEHGEFEQTPNSHLRGSGCDECAGNKKSSTEKFIEKAKKKHGDIYNYDKVDYVGNKIKVIITCPFHGDFKPTPNNHLKGSGCGKCADAKMALKQTLTQAEFIEKAKIIHGNKYNYDKVEYINCSTKVM